jgi:hypothetical protein
MAKKAKEADKGEEKTVDTEKRQFRVVYPLRKDGKLYSPGDIIELALTEDEEIKLAGQSLEEFKKI